MLVISLNDWRGSPKKDFIAFSFHEPAWSTKMEFQKYELSVYLFFQ